ncbi:hypothetical protein [Nocardioides sp. W7]|uniref:hypothetical protein n=1 Tax=Nocardioides sp. W7 TaxID=2931390 RepID=UPI001FD3F15D|nr:hypothetical protein [Nocardioides sp. W7]
MAVIRLGERRPVASARRVRLGLPGLSALDRALVESGDLRLPADLVPEPSPTVAALAGVDLDLLLAEAGIALHGHGVLDDVGVTPAVAANLAGLVAAPRRVRVSLAGVGLDLLAYHWVDAAVGGSVVRDGAEAVLSLYDARSFGQEVLDALPDPGPGRRGRSPVDVPLEALTTLPAAADDPALRPELGALLGVEADVVRLVQEWSDSVQGVLHLTVLPSEPDRLPGMLVWFLDQHGWWSARTHLGGDGVRRVRLEPCERRDLVPRLAVLIEGAWA